MAKKDLTSLFSALEKAAEKQITFSSVNLTDYIQDELEVSGTTEPLNGIATLLRPGASKNGNWSYALTIMVNGNPKVIKFLSKKKLDDPKLSGAVLGEYVTPDGKKLLFLN